MIKKLLMVALIACTGFLAGCSLLEDINQSLDYADEAVEHLNKWNEFGQEAPQLIQDAASNEEAKAKLEEELNSLLEEVDAFNQLEPPSIAESVHQQIKNKNEELVGVIENTLADGEVALKQLENSELMNLINDITALMDTVESLGL